MRAFLFSSQSVVIKVITTLGVLSILSGCAARLDEYDERLESLQKRTATLEAKGGMPVGSDRELLEGQKIADVRSQVAAMRNELTVMSGKVEALEHDNKNLNQRVDSLQQ